MSPPRRPTDDAPVAGRRGLLVLAAAVFAAVTTELLPVGLLSQISASFSVEDATTGLLVTAFAAMVAVLSVPLSMATRRVPRKPILLATIGGYALSNLVAAASPTFAVLVVGRIVGGITHALFFSVSIGYASRLVPAEQTGRAMALASVGVSGGLVLGVPLSTALGSAVGWRVSFAAMAVVVAVVLVVAAVVLPPVPGSENTSTRPPGRRRDLSIVVLANGLTYLGTYVLYTFVSIVLLGSGAARSWVGPLLLVFGVCGLVGLRVAAPHLDRSPRASAILIPAAMALGTGAVALTVAGPRLLPVVAASMFWLAAFGPSASLYQSASVRAAASTPETAGAWINASSNAGIGAGAAIGGILLAHAGLTWVAWTSTAIVAGSVGLALVSRSAFPPHGRTDPAP